MQGLKALVIGMGVLIVFGMIVLVYGLMQKASDPDFSFFGKAEKAAPAPSEKIAATPFGDISVRLPAGCRVENMQPDDGKLFVLVGPEGPCTQIIAIELATGRFLGNVKFWNSK